MGADLIVAVCEMKVSKDEALKRASKLVDDDLAGLIQTLDEWGVGPYVGTEEVPAKDEVVGYLHDQVEIVYSNMQRRDCVPLHIEGKTFALTGGMSWGDTPTDAYDAFSVCSSLNLTDGGFE